MQLKKANPFEGLWEKRGVLMIVGWSSTEPQTGADVNFLINRCVPFFPEHVRDMWLPHMLCPRMLLAWMLCPTVESLHLAPSVQADKIHSLYCPVPEPHAGSSVQPGNRSLKTTTPFTYFFPLAVLSRGAGFPSLFSLIVWFQLCYAAVIVMTHSPCQEFGGLHTPLFKKKTEGVRIATCLYLRLTHPQDKISMICLYTPSYNKKQQYFSHLKEPSIPACCSRSMGPEWKLTDAAT